MSPDCSTSMRNRKKSVRPRFAPHIGPASSDPFDKPAHCKPSMCPLTALADVCLLV